MPAFLEQPTSLDQIVGQAHLVFPGSPLELLVSGRGATSVLLYGPPGCGKTTIASIVAHQTGRRFVLRALHGSRRRCGVGGTAAPDDSMRCREALEDPCSPGLPHSCDPPRAPRSTGRANTRQGSDSTVQDFTAGRPRRSPKPNPANQNVTFTGLDVDAYDPNVAALKKSIAGNLAPMGANGITFAEPGEITDARNQIQGREDAYMHVSDGTSHGCLCGYTVQRDAPSGAPECPVCVLLDA
ncbi:AAA family ATPase [Streptomyces turgidiscabies]|uniref:AAA family ATPase n=1 Tax=Streptomyces TaxID=1883 RepID=UPI002FEFCB3C